MYRPSGVSQGSLLATSAGSPAGDSPTRRVVPARTSLRNTSAESPESPSTSVGSSEVKAT